MQCSNRKHNTLKMKKKRKTNVINKYVVVGIISYYYIVIEHMLSCYWISECALCVNDDLTIYFFYLLA